MYAIRPISEQKTSVRNGFDSASRISVVFHSLGWSRGVQCWAERNQYCSFGANSLRWRKVPTSYRPSAQQDSIRTFLSSIKPTSSRVCAEHQRLRLGRTAVGKPHHRQVLLGASSERARRHHCTAEKCDELAPPHCRPRRSDSRSWQSSRLLRKRADVHFGSEADSCSAATHVR